MRSVTPPLHGLVSDGTIGQVDPGRPLTMTDWALVAVYGLAFLWTLDPMQWSLEYAPRIKHLPLLALLVAAPLVVFAYLWNARQSEAIVSRVAMACLPALAFAAWVLAGSLVTRARSDYDNTFLTMGLYAFIGPATAILMLATTDPLRWARACMWVLLVVAFATGWVQVALYGQADVLHNHEYLIAPMAIFALIGVRSRPIAWLLAACFVLFVFAAKKNTAYLTGLVCLGYGIVVLVYERWARTEALRKGLILILLVFVFAALAAMVAYVLANRHELLPTGNTNYRLFTYARAWEKFLASPVYGNGFTGYASEFFPLFQVDASTQVLPTHSDVLDILANGGLLGFGLWLLALFALVARPLRRVLRRELQSVEERAVVHTALAIGLCAVVTCAFNPVLNHPNAAWAAWACLAIALAVTSRPVAPAGPNR